MKNNIVSLDIAQKLKRLGFSWPTMGAYLEVYDYEIYEKYEIYKKAESVEVKFFDSLSDAKFYEELYSLLPNTYEEEEAWTDYMNELKTEDDNTFYRPGIEDIKRNWNIDLREIFLRLLNLEFESEDEKQLFFKKFVPLDYKVVLTSEEKYRLEKNIFIAWVEGSIMNNYPIISELISTFYREEKSEDEEFIKIMTTNIVFNPYDTPTDLFYLPGLWSAPDYTTVIQWLDEIKNIHICIDFDKVLGWRGYLFEHPASKSQACDYNTCLEKIIDSTFDYLIATNDN